jgi:hypothetical protein
MQKMSRFATIATNHDMVKSEECQDFQGINGDEDSQGKWSGVLGKIRIYITDNKCVKKAQSNVRTH